MNTHQAERWPGDLGLLLVGHGSREAQGVADFLTLAGLVAERAAGVDVAPCFLEFAPPTIAAGVARLAERGAREIIVVPVLLFAAGHAKRDIPQAVEQAVEQTATHELTTRQTEHLGCHPALVELSQRRCDEALARHRGNESDESGEPDDVELVLVGRGSHDTEATAEMHQFARLRQQIASDRGQPVRVSVGFVAMAEPELTAALDAALTAAALRDARRGLGACPIVVQPHFLFGGVLASRIAETVADYAKRHPERDWIVAEPLGPDRQLADVIWSRVRAKVSSGDD
jgi:sirohydrochlorin cobaltochelatase